MDTSEPLYSCKCGHPDHYSDWQSRETHFFVDVFPESDLVERGQGDVCSWCAVYHPNSDIA